MEPYEKDMDRKRKLCLNSPGTSRYTYPFLPSHSLHARAPNPNPAIETRNPNPTFFPPEVFEDELDLSLSQPSRRPRHPSLAPFQIRYASPQQPRPLQQELFFQQIQVQEERAHVPSPHSPPPPPPPSLFSPHFVIGSSSSVVVAASSSSINREESTGHRSTRSRRNSGPTLCNGKNDHVLPPFPWVTDRRAQVHSLEYLLALDIRSITGEVQCKRCEVRYTMEYDLQSKFLEIGQYIANNKSTMHNRAPKQWMSPSLPSCRYCHQPECVKPVIAAKKRAINWLFLLLGGMVGCCTLEQLKFFCKHTKNHQTGAKDRVLYLTYLALCKQLDHTGPFDR